jgi:hypothetical protein
LTKNNSMISFRRTIYVKKAFLSVFISGIWITFSEFLRNELLFKSFWIDHFRSIGLKFETLPINGILWMVWSFFLAYIIFRLLSEFSILETMSLAWFSAFIMMWITTFNLQVFPLRILVFAVPLSLIEVVIATFIIKMITKNQFRND